MPPDLVHFLDAGPPPIVFTVGFSAVTVAGRFFEDSIAAARALGRRAVLVGKRIGTETGRSARGRLRLRVRPVLATLPTGCRCRPCRGHRHDGAGDAGGASHAGRALRPRPARQRRTAEAAGGRTHDPRSPLHSSPSRRPSCGTCSTTRRTHNEPRRSGRQMREEDGVRVACDALETQLRERLNAPHSEVMGAASLGRSRSTEE